MRRSYKTKNDYQQILHIYLKRRQKLQQKIDQCRKALKIINKYEDRLRTINEHVKQFTGVSVWQAKACKKPDVVQAKNIFYREALESGISGSYIAKFCGLKNPRCVTVQRRRFIRKPETKQLWRRWKSYISEIS